MIEALGICFASGSPLAGGVGSDWLERDKARVRGGESREGHWRGWRSLR